MIVIFDKSHHYEKVSLVDVIKISLAKCRSSLKIKNVLALLFVIIFIPFLNIGMFSNLLTSIRIP